MSAMAPSSIGNALACATTVGTTPGERTREAIEMRIETLVSRYGLPEGDGARLASLLRLLTEDAMAPTAIRDPRHALDDHLADSLVALELEQVRNASRVVDLGSGAGLPGLPLAIALPDASFSLVESNSRKCSFIERAARACGAENVETVHARAESWKRGRDQFDLATARALAPLGVVVEYAAPLLRVGGTLVAWRGRRDPEGEESAARAAQLLGMEAREVAAVRPYPRARDRHLHLVSKVMDTPGGFPRRPGMASKRPLGATLSVAAEPSDLANR